MSRPYNAYDPSPLANPSPILTLSQSAFKPNINRQRSKRWVEAASVDYGGGDWGSDDWDDDDDYEPSGSLNRRNSFESGDDRHDWSENSAGIKVSVESAKNARADVPAMLPPTPSELEEREARGPMGPRPLPSSLPPLHVSQARELPPPPPVEKDARSQSHMRPPQGRKLPQLPVEEDDGSEEELPPVPIKKDLPLPEQKELPAPLEDNLPIQEVVPVQATPSSNSPGKSLPSTPGRDIVSPPFGSTSPLPPPPVQQTMLHSALPPPPPVGSYTYNEPISNAEGRNSHDREEERYGKPLPMPKHTRVEEKIVTHPSSPSPPLPPLSPPPHQAQISSPTPPLHQAPISFPSPPPPHQAPYAETKNGPPIQDKPAPPPPPEEKFLEPISERSSVISYLPPLPNLTSHRHQQSSDGQDQGDYIDYIDAYNSPTESPKALYHDYGDTHFPKQSPTLSQPSPPPPPQKNVPLTLISNSPLPPNTSPQQRIIRPSDPYRQNQDRPRPSIDSSRPSIDSPQLRPSSSSSSQVQQSPPRDRRPRLRSRERIDDLRSATSRPTSRSGERPGSRAGGAPRPVSRGRMSASPFPPPSGRLPDLPVEKIEGKNEQRERGEKEGKGKEFEVLVTAAFKRQNSLIPTPNVEKEIELSPIPPRSSTLPDLPSHQVLQRRKQEILEAGRENSQAGRGEVSLKEDVGRGSPNPVLGSVVGIVKGEIGQVTSNEEVKHWEPKESETSASTPASTKTGELDRFLVELERANTPHPPPPPHDTETASDGNENGEEKGDTGLAASEGTDPIISNLAKNRESMGVLSLYDSYWTSDPPSPPPPALPTSLPPSPPLKSPRRASAPLDEIPKSPPSKPLESTEMSPRSITTIRAKPEVQIPQKIEMEMEDSTPSDVLETPDSELLEMFAARRQYLARTGTGGLTGNDSMVEVLRVKDDERLEEKPEDGSQRNAAISSPVTSPSPTPAAAIEPEQAPVEEEEEEEEPQTPQLRVLGPDSEGMEVLTGPTRVIVPKDESEEEESEYARELVSQFSRPQTLMLKETMPMPSGISIMPPMPPLLRQPNHDHPEPNAPEVFGDSDGSESEPEPEPEPELGPEVELRDIPKLEKTEERKEAYEKARKRSKEEETGIEEWVAWRMKEGGSELLETEIVKVREGLGRSSIQGSLRKQKSRLGFTVSAITLHNHSSVEDVSAPFQHRAHESSKIGGGGNGGGGTAEKGVLGQAEKFGKGVLGIGERAGGKAKGFLGRFGKKKSEGEKAANKLSQNAPAVLSANVTTSDSTYPPSTAGSSTTATGSIMPPAGNQSSFVPQPSQGRGAPYTSSTETTSPIVPPAGYQSPFAPLQALKERQEREEALEGEPPPGKEEQTPGGKSANSGHQGHVLSDKKLPQLVIPQTQHSTVRYATETASLPEDSRATQSRESEVSGLMGGNQPQMQFPRRTDSLQNRTNPRSRGSDISGNANVGRSESVQRPARSDSLGPSRFYPDPPTGPPPPPPADQMQNHEFSRADIVSPLTPSYDGTAIQRSVSVEPQMGGGGSGGGERLEVTGYGYGVGRSQSTHVGGAYGHPVHPSVQQNAYYGVPRQATAEEGFAQVVPRTGPKERPQQAQQHAGEGPHQRGQTQSSQYEPQDSRGQYAPAHPHRPTMSLQQQTPNSHQPYHHAHSQSADILPTTADVPRRNSGFMKSLSLNGPKRQSSDNPRPNANYAASNGSDGSNEKGGKKRSSFLGALSTKIDQIRSPVLSPISPADKKGRKGEKRKGTFGKDMFSRSISTGSKPKSQQAQPSQDAAQAAQTQIPKIYNPKTGEYEVYSTKHQVKNLPKPFVEPEIHLQPQSWTIPPPSGSGHYVLDPDANPSPQRQPPPITVSNQSSPQKSHDHSHDHDPYPQNPHFLHPQTAPTERSLSPDAPESHAPRAASVTPVSREWNKTPDAAPDGRAGKSGADEYGFGYLGPAHEKEGIEGRTFYEDDSSKSRESLERLETGQGARQVPPPVPPKVKIEEEPSPAVRAASPAMGRTPSPANRALESENPAVVRSASSAGSPPPKIHETDVEVEAKAKGKGKAFEISRSSELVTPHNPPPSNRTPSPSHSSSKEDRNKVSKVEGNKVSKTEEREFSNEKILAEVNSDEKILADELEDGGVRLDGDEELRMSSTAWPGWEPEFF